MEKVNLTEKVIEQLSHITVLTELEKNSIEYLLNDSFTRLLGDYYMPDENIDMFLYGKINNGVQMQINTIYNEPLGLEICKVDNCININSKCEDVKPITLVVNGECAKCNTKYKDANDVSVDMFKQVDFENNDVSKFFISKRENDMVAYYGSLSTISTTKAGSDYFYFNSSFEKSGEKSIIKKIADFFTSDPVVSVPTSRKLHMLSNYAEPIFDKLEYKLEEKYSKTKGTAKVRTINNNKANK